MEAKRSFECKFCAKVFSLAYRRSAKKTPMFCSKSCAGKAQKMTYHRASDLEKKAVSAIKERGRYMTSGEICKAIGISNKTLSKFNVSTLTCNRNAGFKRPKRLFENLVLDVLEEHFEVVREVEFDGCVSPKGFNLRFDFMLEGTSVLVEADGSQHASKKHPWASIYYQECDRIKDRFAEENGYLLIRIPYSKRVDYDYVMSFITAGHKATKQSATTNLNA